MSDASPEPSSDQPISVSAESSRGNPSDAGATAASHESAIPSGVHIHKASSAGSEGHSNHDASITLKFGRSMGKTVTILSQLDARIENNSQAVVTPDVGSFREYLESCARVPVGRGEYGPYTFKGREAMIGIVDLIDQVLREPWPDSTISICGGAQFGKSVLELNLGAYATGIAWMNWGFYLPDKDLVEGMVDTKFRPDILDQLDWFAQMTQVGRAVNKSGKAVNRKGAFSVTDGKHRSQGMILGLNKIPTSFTFDVTTLDEVDDIKPSREKFVRGRMTSSAVRLMVKIGTQRVAGRGQHKAWKDGSQGVMIHTCPTCAHEQNLEENWPRVCRVALDGTPKPEDPFSTNTGDFRHEDNGETIAVHDPTHHYYFGCVRCGAELDRSLTGFRWEHRRPERIKLRNWSFRISQFGIPAIDVSQIVAEWGRAVMDPEAMVTFLCDRKAMPESTAQKLTGDILDRARSVETYDMKPTVGGDCVAFGGLDTGRRCWFAAREVKAADEKRLIHVEQVPLGNLVDRVTTLFHMIGLQTLFIDQAPATDEARTLALKLNGLDQLEHWPAVPQDKTGSVSFPSGLRWNGATQRWENLRCAVVAFTKRKLGAGISHNFDVFEKGSETMFVPLIEANRFETIDRVVREFLTPNENVADVVFVPGQKPSVRLLPAMRLPRKGRGAPVILETLDEHFIVGSEREELKDGTLGDYVDACENHFLLADAYSGLAELEGGSRHVQMSSPFLPATGRRADLLQEKRERSIAG
jgi:hypothetical protein